jgi:hypothetical protein
MSGEVYHPSPHPFAGLPDIDYPFDDKIIVVTPLQPFASGKNQFQHGLRRPGRVHQGSSRRHLAGQFYGV